MNSFRMAHRRQAHLSSRTLDPTWVSCSWETVRDFTFDRQQANVLVIVAASAGYLLLGMLSSLVFRAVRDALPGNPAAQERILGASLFAMAVADVSLWTLWGKLVFSLIFIRLPGYSVSWCTWLTTTRDFI